MPAAVLLIGPRESARPLVDAFARKGVESLVVPDTVGAMACLGRTDLAGIVVLAARQPLNLASMFRVARLRHRRLALFVMGPPPSADASAEGFHALNVNVVSAGTPPEQLVSQVLASMIDCGSWATEPGAGDVFDDDMTIEDAVLFVDPSAPPLLEGELGPGAAGGALLASIFGQELTGRLDVHSGPAVGTLYFAQGEPVAADRSDGDTGVGALLVQAGVVTAAELPREPIQRPLISELSHRGVVGADKLLQFLRDFVRGRVLDLVEQESGAYAFYADSGFVESRTLTRVNAFGLMFESRRRRIKPFDLLRAQDELAAKFVIPGAGLARAAARLKKFSGDIDLSEAISGRRTAQELIGECRLDALMGTLVLLTLEDARLVSFSDVAVDASSLPSARRHVARNALASQLGDALPVFDDGPTEPADPVSQLYLALGNVTDPHLVLDVPRGASRDVVEAAYEATLAMIESSISGGGRSSSVSELARRTAGEVPDLSSAPTVLGAPPPRAPASVAPGSASMMTAPPSTSPGVLERADIVKRKLERARVSLVVETASEVGADGRRYELVEQIGRGGMAEVFVGRQLGMQGFAKKVVLKRILPEYGNNKMFVDMFLEEARVAARISHPNVVQLFDLGRAGRDYYIVMEHVDGIDLNRALGALTSVNLALPVEISARIIADIAAALHAAHSYVDDTGRALPIIHRDVSPHNVLVSRQGHVKLADFGIAKPADSRLVTAAGIFKGKTSFLSPEYINGRPADARSDIFAAGICLYMLLVGKHPFAGKDMAAIIELLLRADFPPISSARPGVPSELQAIARKAMARDASDRWQTAKEMQVALEAFLTVYAQPATAHHIGEWMERALDIRATGGDSRQARMEPTRIVLA